MGWSELSHVSCFDLSYHRYKAPGITVVGVNVPHEEFKSQAEVCLV